MAKTAPRGRRRSTTRTRRSNRSRRGTGSRRSTARNAGTSRRTLNEYRRKRDFGKTSEPKGTVKRARKRRRLAFVVQKHDASRLHFDLRLEVDGVMHSWALPKGPTINPRVRRLAVQVEDHPIEYNRFEGTIPPGEYGAGTVMLWDRGTYTPDDVQEGESIEDAVRRGLDEGKLNFTLEGDRLNGSFALVRTDAGPKPKWLLIKHRDHGAGRIDITKNELTSVATGRTMDEIAEDNNWTWE